MMTITRKNYSLDHIILGLVTAVSSIGLIFSSFSHDFVVDPVVSEWSVYISLGLILFLCAIYWILYVKGVFCSFRESSLFAKGLKGFALLLGLPVFLFWLFWVNSAFFVPKLFTEIFGEDATLIAEVKKQSRASRRGWGCRHRLEFEAFSRRLFFYCISEQTYNFLPDRRIEVELLVTQSELGYVVEHLTYSKGQL
ncbi:hypothetical protein [Marinobacter piscensis]|uniref:hypothetical protein n=1 Tax=Marinobacter piscensis TaxID=1562308 RepID=UPI001C92BC41|nr:hypothetical protein [Marinobacter piscensis]